MKTTFNLGTHDLGHGWDATFDRNVAGIETMIIRNRNNGQNIRLGTESIDTLKAIFAKADKLSTDSVECPHCHWGFAPAVIDQHIREKH
jgi:hypothetical protein